MRSMRRLLPVLAAVTCVVALAGCETGPSKVNSAAIVGDGSVPLDEVQDELTWLLENVPDVADPQVMGIDAVQLARIIVGYHIDRELVAIAAEREGLSANADDIDQLIELVGGMEQAPSVFRTTPDGVEDFARDVVLIGQLGWNYSDRLKVSVAGGMVAMDEPGTLHEVARDLGQDIAADPAGALDVVTEAGHQVVDEEFQLADAQSIGAQLGVDVNAVITLFGVEPGTVVALPADQQGGTWLVVLVSEREVLPGAAGNAPTVDDLIEMYPVGRALLGPIADEVGVEVNPRYGNWDRTRMGVADRAEPPSGYVIPARTDRS